MTVVMRDASEEPERFDRSRLRVLPLGERRHKLELAGDRKLAAVEATNASLQQVGRAIVRAKSGAPPWFSCSVAT